MVVIKVEGGGEGNRVGQMSVQAKVVLYVEMRRDIHPNLIKSLFANINSNYRSRELIPVHHNPHRPMHKFSSCDFLRA